MHGNMNVRFSYYRRFCFEVIVHVSRKKDSLIMLAAAFVFVKYLEYTGWQTMITISKFRHSEPTKQVQIWKLRFMLLQ
jgi:hypothetical protein